MSASTDATPASNVLGTIGTVFWCIQLVPQIWYNWRRKKTEGLPPAMGFLWAEVNLPMQIQPQIFGTFSAIIWAQILHYDHHDWVFLCIDTLGGLFSIFALVAQGSFDILGGVMYIVVVVLELGIYLSHIIWRIRFREARKEARLSGRNVEDVLRMSGPA
ncbi:hypothetical protein ASPTUDRAFT_61942 [Aspergillus tubingensis CBS 134.48]|uniref:PQ loop repeat protein n=1 Tax=Aspergillus tubingensis (strain CBS 134.48) TaxID=767770 RepID=A0A1L9NDX3_ASPTC|nr:hypothetical protein ASPTUDRAFT_61942 [Aspergillus tubingensis CBS 134.48]